MSLDLSKVVAQIGGMIAGIRAGSEERQRHLRTALDVFHNKAIDLDTLNKKIIASRGKTTFLVAELVEGLNQRYKPSPLPAEFSVLATDGSHIDVDRHKSTRCYLINIGKVMLGYGSNPEAVLESIPRLYSDDEDMVIKPQDGLGRVLDRVLLGIKRDVEELNALLEMAVRLSQESIALGLLDGSLIKWGLEAYPDFVADALLKNGYIRCLDELKNLAEKRQIAIASYISFPGSTDVVNTLRLVLCPHEPANCDSHCKSSNERDCDSVAGVRDRDIFNSLLEEGERSALFISPSKILEYYGEHHVYFCYMKIDEEIARIEIPKWIALNEERLNMVHTLVLDQCRRGHGYPVALSEAHEQAVLTGADRENFWQMVDELLVEEGMSSAQSVKSQSKRTKWV